MGITSQQARSLRTLVRRQLRAISRSPTHLTRETNEALLRRLQVEDPVQALYDQSCKVLCKAKGAQYEAANFMLEDIIWLEKVQCPFVNNLLPAVPKHAQVRLRELPMSARQFDCPVCGLQFANTAMLNTHITRAHAGQGRLDCGVFDHAKHGRGGMPVCNWCGHAFKLWTGLRMHLARGVVP